LPAPAASCSCGRIFSRKYSNCSSAAICGAVSAWHTSPSSSASAAFCSISRLQPSAVASGNRRNTCRALTTTLEIEPSSYFCRA
jgi:hypothetical protein